MEENAILTRNGVEISIPPMDAKAKLNMERCAEFVARMIQKYGKEVMAEIEDKNGNSISEDDID